MKKILLSILLLNISFLGFSQGVVFNEFYPNPGIKNATTFNHEYFELYNTTENAISLDCYTVVAYDNVNHRAYVYQLPNVSIPGYGFLVFTNSVTDPLTIRYINPNNPVTYGGINIYSWNKTIEPNSFLKLYTLSGNSLTTNGTNLNNVNDFILDPSSGSGISMFLFNGNDLVNGFIGNGAPALPSDFASITNFPISSSCGNVNLNLSSIQLNEVELQSVTAATGNDNGYYRTTNGLCGTWQKSSNATQKTPGTSNGGSSESGTFATVIPNPECFNPDQNSTTWDINMTIGNSIYLPATYSIYQDLNGDELITAADGAALRSGSITTLDPKLEENMVLSKNNAILVRVVAQSNCIIYFRSFVQECITLPVKLKSFTASRKQTNVELKWTTTLEQNNSGFELQRQSGASGWQKIGFVNSKATDGNSISDLHYSFIDANDSRGVSQYRLMQVDLDDNAKYSEIRSVQGIGQEARTIISPNPTANGRVNVTFQSANSKKDLQLTDMHGRMLKQWNAYSDNSLQITDLTPGIYQLRIVDRETGTQTVEKIMVVNR